MSLGRSVAELGQTVSAREMQDWAEYWTLEPWGAMRDNLHTGIMASLLFNANRGQGQEPRQPQDFMITDGESAKETKMQKFVANLRAMAKPKKK